MKRRPNPPGSAMIAAILVILIVFALGAAYLGLNLSRAKSAETSQNLDRAQHITDAALSQARRFLFVYQDSGTWNWNDILEYNQNFPTDPLAVQDDAMAVIRSGGDGGTVGSPIPEAPVPPDPNQVTTDPPLVWGVHSLYGDGAWYMVIRNNPEDPDPLIDTDQVLVVTVIATMRDGSQRAIEARLKFDPPVFVPDAAILSGGSLRIPGNPEVRLSPSATSGRANVFSNANISVSGDPYIEGAAQSVGSIDVTGGPTIEDGTDEGLASAPLPNADPTAYRHLADYILTDAGTVTLQDGTLVAMGSWYNLEFKNGTWTSNNGDPPPQSVLYVETDLNFGGNTSFQNTFIVEGSADVGGSPTGGPPNISPVIGNVSFLAGGDIKLHGNTQYEGFFIAREQVLVRGNVGVLDGAVISVDEFDQSDLVSTASEFKTELTGNPTVTYLPDQQTFLTVDNYSLTLESVRRMQ